MNIIFFLVLLLSFSLRRIQYYACKTENFYLNHYKFILKSLEIYGDFQNKSYLNCKYNDTISLTLYSLYPTIYDGFDPSEFKLLTLVNFKGLTFNSNGKNIFIFYYLFGSLNFYINQILITGNCNLLSKITSNYSYINADNVYFSYGTLYSKVYYIEAFKFQKTQALFLRRISKTFIKNNYFKFIRDNRSSIHSFDSNVNSLSL